MKEKRTLKIIITLILIILFLLVGRNVSNADILGAYTKNNEEYVPITNQTSLQNQNKVYVKRDFFRNTGMYCVEAVQHILDGIDVYEEMTCTSISSKKDSTNLEKGMLYILSQREGRENYTNGTWVDNNVTKYCWTDYRSDPTQLAMWAYLKTNKEEIQALTKKGIFEYCQSNNNTEKLNIIINNEDINNSENMITYVVEFSDKSKFDNYKTYKGLKSTWDTTNNKGTITYGCFKNNNNNNTIDYTNAKKAFTLYRNALNICNGNSIALMENDCTIFVLSNSNKQNLIYVPDKPNEVVKQVKLNFQKQDFNGKQVEGAKITIEGVKNVHSISKQSLTIGTDSTVITPKENKGNFKIKIKETAPTGYQGLEGEVTLTVTYNQTTGAVTKIDSDNTEYVPNSTNSNTVIIKNKPKYNFVINKTEPKIKNNPQVVIPGVKFKIDLGNVEHIDGYELQTHGATQNPPVTVYVTTDSNGQIKLNGIVPKDPGSPITITYKELKEDGTEGAGISLVIKKEDGTEDYYYTTDGIGTEIIIQAGTQGGTTRTKDITNQPYITLSGVVWQDRQKGVKDVSGPNGLNDDGLFVEGVKVYLYKQDGTYTGKLATTDKDGKYNFNDVQKTDNGYYVVFEYNGIKYQETNGLRNTSGGDSKASESNINRTSFNNRFKTISAGQSNDGTPLGYGHKGGSGGKTIATLLANNDGTNSNVGNTNMHFKMQAKSGVYKESNSDINCGLVEKVFDLALGTDVESARLELNDKVVTYNYAQIMDSKIDKDLDALLENISADSKDPIIYNLYLYKSDYRYRIDDYKKGDAAIKNKLNTEDNNKNGYNNLKELEAYITYKTMLKGQTTQEAKVEEFVYYYDEVYSPHIIDGQTIKEGKQEYEGEKYKFTIDEDHRKIIFTSYDKTPSIKEENGYRVEILLEFKVNKDEQGVLLKENCTNIAEITKYSTDEGGLIDQDSQPGNLDINANQYWEDDSDKSKGITISIPENKARTISGTVWDDGEFNKANGKVDKNENGEITEEVVNDVIVQLIEIKKIGNKYYEYIWQETKSGSNIVKTTARNGYEGKEYKNEVVVGSGQYQFKDYIPGDYIIRYIYGDGTYYEVSDNVKKYNGQDYKSTIDKSYTEVWYNQDNYKGEYSVARDNEARRLEVMAYSTTIDKTVGESLANKTALENTWMCAETSKIDVPIDKVNNPTQENTVSYPNMNFGLALRPKTNLVLEKHITGLKITPNGTGVQSIVDAKAENIEEIVNGEKVGTQGVTTGLSTIKSTIENRGFWLVATDVEELAQGAELEVEYTYVIRNDGEKDYLSEYLVNAYKDNYGSYKGTLTEKSAEVKKFTKGYTDSYGEYLGEFYYTGKKSEEDAEVPSRVEELQEALNNSLTFDSSVSGEDFKKSNSEPVEKTVYKVDGKEAIANINTVIQNSSVSKFLTTANGKKYENNTNADWNKKVKLKTVLSSSTGGELGATIPSYIAEIVKYSNAAGRRDMVAEPENLSYVHSDNTEMTMEKNNQHDEFWGESIIITKPTGEDKLTPIQIAIITIASIAAIGVGIVLIKKLVLKK